MKPSTKGTALVLVLFGLACGFDPLSGAEDRMAEAEARMEESKRLVERGPQPMPRERWPMAGV